MINACGDLFNLKHGVNDIFIRNILFNSEVKTNVILLSLIINLIIYWLQHITYSIINLEFKIK